MNKDELHYILDNMVYSFSNIQAFCTCPRMWELKYVECVSGTDNIYGKYGTCCHRVLQDYLDGNVNKEDMSKRFTEEFAKCVTDVPPEYMDDNELKFFENGMEYFSYEIQESIVDRILKLYTKEYHRYEVKTEEYFEYTIPELNKKFCGYIDLLIMFYDENDNLIDVTIADHKTSTPPPLKKGVMKNAQYQQFTQYKRQLYLYADYIINQFNLKPSSLVLNYIKNHQLVRFDYDEDEHKETIEWIGKTIEQIYNTDMFDMTGSYYFCKNICDYRDDVC